MIRLNKLVSPERSTDVQCGTIADALKHFDVETKFMVVRYDTDEELLGLDVALTEKNESAMKGAALASVRNPACTVWQCKLTSPDGDGWRTIWIAAVVSPQAQQQGLRRIQ